jgi:hypothetical protein
MISSPETSQTTLTGSPEAYKYNRMRGIPAHADSYDGFRAHIIFGIKEREFDRLTVREPARRG